LCRLLLWLSRVGPASSVHRGSLEEEVIIMVSQAQSPSSVLPLRLFANTQLVLPYYLALKDREAIARQAFVSRDNKLAANATKADKSRRSQPT
jgi:hypothetical protein